MKSAELTYILTEERGVPSFDPLHSDTLLNAYFIEQLVGTLVKGGFDGTPEGCLAESWVSSPDHLKYSFKIRKGLTCEDGTAITAEAIKRNMNHLFHLYSTSNADLPVFEHLVGFDELRTGSAREVKGISIDGENIEFNFTRIPDGLLAFLSMPYYGFYCDGNFDRDGNWKDPHKIIASGAWRLSHFSNDAVQIARRPDWFRSFPNSPELVTVKMMPFDEAKKQPSTRTIIQKRIESVDDIPPGYRKFLSTPTDLKAVVLSPFRKGPFADQNIRRLFQSKIQELTSKEKIASENAKYTITFYSGQTAKKNTDAISDSILKKWNGYELITVTSNALTTNQLNYVHRILSSAADSLGLKIKFVGEDRSTPGWKERLDALEDMDIRVVRVSVGGSYEPWGVRMMFCSRMGVSFPDPTGRISKLTDNLTDRLEDTARNFENVVAEDAAVIPLFHTSFSWLVSEDLGMDHLAPTADLLRYELVELK